MAHLDRLRQKEWSFQWQTALEERAARLQHTVRRLLEAAQTLEAKLDVVSDPDLGVEHLSALQRVTALLQRSKTEDFRPALDDGFERYTSGIETFEATLNEIRAARRRLSAHYTDNEIIDAPIEELIREWREAQVKVWPLSQIARSRIRKLLQTYAESGEANPEQDLAALRVLKHRLPELERSELSALPCFAGEGTDISRVRAYLSDAKELRRALALLQTASSDGRSSTSALLYQLDPRTRSDDLVVAMGYFSSSFDDWLDAFEAFNEHAGGVLDSGGIRSQLEWLRQLEKDYGRLRDWTRWVADVRQAKAQGLGPLVEALEAGLVEDAGSAFEVAYFSWWLPLAIDESPLLRGFLHWEQDHRVQQFRALDEAAQRLAAGQVVRAVAHDLPIRDGVPRKSELGLLRHQLGLQRPSTTIRRLIGEMPTTFRKLTPCVLMSPLSIAQYLPPDQKQFDVVIFDEASQITTWDAIGAIARGRQSIIVGDPKQLPPTNFFGRTEEDDEETPEYEKDLPSILDEAAAAGLPAHQLNWHYRSRDETLIAFSNLHYYGDRLITFPSPGTGTKAITHHRLDGIFARGGARTNEIEARAIVRILTQRMSEALDTPEPERPTFGVISFNIQQRDLILDLLDDARRRDPRMEWFFEDAREEPVFVKNLENVQGDERDVICFSVTFGPSLDGKVTMNFGALNKDGGEKRLNVAVTRARQEMHVFTSLGSDMIDLSRTRARGVADLKNFLAYVERGVAALTGQPAGSMGGFDSPFEEAVYDALTARGWEVRTQIGVSEFRIDLGVVHPDHSGAFLAGIECDGYTYHRSASARDRDRIREGVLRGLGWEILRIWSTDWFMNRTEALDRLHVSLAELLEKHRARREREAEERAQRTAAALEEPQAPARDDDLSVDELVLGGDYLEDEVEEHRLQLHVVDSTTRQQESQVDARRSLIKKSNAQDDPPASSHAELDPERFFEESYVSTLERLIDHIVVDEGPLRLDRLERMISRLHGWQRTGRRIRDRIADCIGENECYLDADATFVWASGTFTSRIPFREPTDRSVREIPKAEILWLVECSPDLLKQDDPVLAVARRIGVSRLSEDARSYLGDCLKELD